MRIGIIGTGNMGRAVGVRLAGLGHDVMFGSRGRDGARGGQPCRPCAGAGTNEAAARHGEVLVWTIRDPDPASVLSDPSLLDGKVAVNLDNRDHARDVQGSCRFGQAIAEASQAHAPRARVIEALNAVAMEALDTSPEKLRAAGAQLFVAGDDADARTVVSGLLGGLGFEAADPGGDRWRRARWKRWAASSGC